ncbi:Peptide/nickel transport system ATP-binding protein [Paraburkholderia unamae]|uniref:ABC transporter ATP-binding protein n=1 Tax=Paraburkholderia unamae TaxID=219649 RepID=UPI001CAD34AA|nr:ABC transporter ATP-binding protein [Paraburkholderia unamae]CAG9271303.1 Peptide/nickel transport system ATP-binding protein [Paraburkholderia unamae]
MMRTAPPPMLHIEQLRVELATDATHATHAALIDGIDLRIAAGEVVALIGESGSGKSLTALALMNLLPRGVRQTAGQLRWADTDTHASSPHPAAMVFQSPRSALNPVRRIGAQFDDVFAARRLPRRLWRANAVSLLEQVAMTPPERYLRAYPHELSGGLCQRVVIALALAREPRLLIADEPTTGLDALTQHQVLDLLLALRRTREMALLLITHDLQAALAYSDRIAVMHAGQLVEVLPSAEFLHGARHPYSRALVAATPALAADLHALQGVRGNLPDLRGPLPACRFHSRCTLAQARCATDAPPVVTSGADRFVWCWQPVSIETGARR